MEEREGETERVRSERYLPTQHCSDTIKGFELRFNERVNEIAGHGCFEEINRFKTPLIKGQTRAQPVKKSWVIHCIVQYISHCTIRKLYYFIFS